MLRTLLLYLLLFVSATLAAQGVSSVRVRQEGKQVVIEYDLAGKPADRFAINLFYSQNNGEWKEPQAGLSGAVGTDIAPGSLLNIRWSPLQELSKLTGSGYKFKVKATLKSSDPYGIAENMVLVEGGTFNMGCTGEQGSECFADERPIRRVILRTYKISKYEVTQVQWSAVMGSNPSYNSGCVNCPVQNVSWNDVNEFIAKLNDQTGLRYRLPTEAEWEYAARGGNKSRGYRYSGSNEINNVGWYTKNCGSQIHPVGQKEPNELGLYDMSGNVWEWCVDWYSYSYYNSSATHNPKGPVSGTYHLVRGGSWVNNVWFCRTSSRYRNSPNVRNFDLGFRLVQDL